MTEMAVRDGVASVMVKDYAQKRLRTLQRELGTHRARPATLTEIVADQPELANRGAFVRSPSPDGPLAIGYVQ